MLLIFAFMVLQDPTPSPLNAFGQLIPMDNVGSVQVSIEKECRLTGLSESALIRQEATLGKTLEAGARPDSLLLQLGCVRSVLASRKVVGGRIGLFMPLGSSWAHGAIEAFSFVLAHDPGDVLAAKGLTLIALQAGRAGLPVKLLPEERTGARVPEPWGPIANAIYGAVRAGVRDSTVLRGCTSYLLDSGDFGAAKDCSTRALALGADSSWHLLRLAYVAVLEDDALAATAFFQQAVAVAGTVDARREVGWHMNVRFADASWVEPSGYVLEPMKPPDVWAWLSLSDSVARVTWWSRRAELLTARAGRTLQQLLPDHFRSISYARGSFHDCLGTISERPQDIAAGRHLLPCYPSLDPDIHHLPIEARLYRMWSMASGEVIGLVSYAVPVNSLIFLEEAGGVVAPMTIELRQRDRVANYWSDTSFSGRFRLSAQKGGHLALTGVLEVPSGGGMTEWALVASQSQNRRGLVFGEGLAPIEQAALELSDIVIGSPSQGLRWAFDRDTISLLPFRTASVQDTLDFFVQVRSSQERPGVNFSLAVYHVKSGISAEKPSVQIAVRTRVPAGIEGIRRALDVSHLGSGEYRIVATVTDSDGTSASRTTGLVLK